MHSEAIVCVVKKKKETLCSGHLDIAGPDLQLIIQNDGNEVAETEVGPVIFYEVDLDIIRGLPEHVVAQALHTACADEDVKGWAPRGSKMSLKVVYGDCATFIKSMLRI